MKTRLWLVALFLFSGCAYYNGLYNANLLVREARKAEREGRFGEARSMWGQVIVKTDTVLARYPDSDYRDDALYLKGMALTELNSCQRALEPLRQVSDSSPDPELTGSARIYLARCYLQTGDDDSALAAVNALADSSSPFQDDALWIRGRIHHRQFNDVAARRDLEMSGSDSVGFDLALVLLALDDPDGARIAVERMFEHPYVEERWISVLDTLAASDPLAASEITFELTEHGHLTRGEKARLLIADASRSESVDPQFAAERYRSVVALAGDSVEASIARVHLSLLRLRSLRGADSVPVIAAELRDAAQRGGVAETLAGPSIKALDAMLGDTLSDEFADLRRFLVAEMLRDSAQAFELASAVFASVAADFPNSSIAPKALIAARVGSAVGGDLVAQLQRSYPRSPYTLALLGVASPRYSAVEDSLKTLLQRIGLTGERPTSEGARRVIDEEIVN